VRAAAGTGYPDAIINVETISPVIAPLGSGNRGPISFIVARAAVAEDQGALNDYIINAGEYMKAFRLTGRRSGRSPLGRNRLLPRTRSPVPILRVKGTGHTGMGRLWPAVKEAAHGHHGTLTREHRSTQAMNFYDFKELDTKIWTAGYPLPRCLPR